MIYFCGVETNDAVGNTMKKTCNPIHENMSKFDQIYSCTKVHHTYSGGFEIFL